MQPSKVTLKAIKGVVTDISNDDLPEGFAIASLNGRFLPAKDGKSFTWIGVKGEKKVKLIGDWVSSCVISQMESFDNTIIAFVYNTNSVDTAIWKLVPNYSIDQSIDSFTVTILVSDPNDVYLQAWPTDLEQQVSVSKIRVVRETDTIYTIYWIDKNGTLKSVRIVTGATITSLTNSSFSQEVSFGTMEFKGLVAGSLPGGAMFYTYRLLGANGSITDWSMAMGPVMIHNKLATDSSWEKFHTIKYVKKGEKSGCGVELFIDSIDTRFEKIQIAACISADNSTFERGYIFHEEKINSRTSLTVNHITDKSYGTVLSEDIQISTQSVIGCVDFEIVNNIMVVIGPKTDDTLDTATPSDPVQFNKVTTATAITHTTQIPFDVNIHNTIQPAYTTDPIGVAQTVPWTHSVSLYKDQSTLANVTKTITAGTGYVGYKNPVFETLIKNCWRGETYRIGMVPVTSYGKRLGVRHIADVTIPQRGDHTDSTNVELISLVGQQYYANVIGMMVSGIDITQWVHGNVGEEVCDIKGFHIVVAPREKRRLHEGVLMCAAETNAMTDTEMPQYGLVLGNRADTNPYDSVFKSRPIPGLYQYYSPDVQNDLIITAEPGSKMHIEAQANGLFTGLMPDTFSGNRLLEEPITGTTDAYIPDGYDTAFDVDYGGLRIWNKFYSRLNSFTYAWSPHDRREADIEGYYDLPTFNGTIDHDSQAIYVKERANRKFINAYWGSFKYITAGTRYNQFGGGAASRLMVLDDGHQTQAISPFATIFSSGMTIVSAMNNTILDITPDDNELATTQYRSCWHYQPIDTTVLGKIRKSNGRYVFDNVEVFPGDSYIVPYALNRVFHTINYGNPEFTPATTTDPYASNSFVVPLQSNINWLMHDGDSWLKHRSLIYHDSDDNKYVTGIGITKIDDLPAYGILEKSLYPQFANVIYGQNLYFALPESIFYTNDYPMRFFWSKRKTDAEEIDSFRQFPFENYQSIQGSYGLPVAICGISDGVLIFTEDGIGQVPIDERSSITDAAGKSLLIGQTPGVGRFTIIDRKHGLSLVHRNSLSQYGEDFTWFDFKNKEWVFFGKGQGIVDLSLKFKFQSDLEVLFKDKHTVNRTTIRTSFLSAKEIMMYDPTKGRSWIFDYLNGLYQGRRDIVVRESMMFGSIPIILTATDVNIPGFGLQNQAYGQIVDTELTMVANVNPMQPKIWDSFRLQGVNIEKIILNNDQLNPETSTIIVLGTDHLMNQFSIVENLDDVYVGEIPLTENYDYLRGYYVTVRICGLKVLGLQPKLNYLTLNYRNDAL